MDNAKSSTLNFIEFVLILLVVILGIIILNFFNIIPLSKNFPGLFSFLPHKMSNTIAIDDQTIKTTVTDTIQPTVVPYRVREIIPPSEPKTYTNDKNTGTLISIPKSPISVSDVLTINVSLSRNKEEAKQEINNGFVFANDTNNTNYSYNQINSLYIFYWYPTNNWTIGYMYEGKKKYYPLPVMKSEDIKGDFVLTISKDGKTVKVLYENTEKVLDLPVSLYTISNKMVSYAQLEAKPNATLTSSLTVNSLNYQIN